MLRTSPNQPLLAAFARAAATLWLAAALPVVAQPEAEPEVQWLLYELPPLYITQGPQQGQGVLDRLLRDVLLPGLPGFKHRTIAVPPKRLEVGLQHLPNGCAFGMLKNAEREAYLYFSRPFPVNAVPVLLVRRADVERWRGLLDGQGRLPLRSWLQRPDVRIGQAEGRAYGAGVDALLTAQPAERVERVTSQNPALNLVSMLKRGRIDGLMVLPFEIGPLARDAGVDPDDLQALPLAEQEPPREGHVACARTPLGAEVVKRADKVIASAVFRQAQAPRARP